MCEFHVDMGLYDIAIHCCSEVINQMVAVFADCVMTNYVYMR